MVLSNWIFHLNKFCAQISLCFFLFSPIILYSKNNWQFTKHFLCIHSPILISSFSKCLLNYNIKGSLIFFSWAYIWMCVCVCTHAHVCAHVPTHAHTRMCLQSFPASVSCPISQLFGSGSQSIGASASASVLPMNIQGWFPLGLTGLISLQPKGLARVFSNTTGKRQFFSTQLSSQSNFHIHTWPLEKP